jgi:hypothetical protein
MLGTGLTGGVGRSERSKQSCCSCSVCKVACIGLGGACMCAGELFVVLGLWFGGLCLLLEHSFVLDVSSVGVSYVLTRFATALESLWVYYRSQINPQAHGYRCSFHSGVF